jgi:hypothetical protein
LESGRIKGKMVYLEVYKAPLYIDGILVGVCGTGRDLTEYIEAYNGCCCKEKNLDGTISGIFSKYHFE